MISRLWDLNWENLSPMFDTIVTGPIHVKAAQDDGKVAPRNIV